MTICYGINNNKCNKQASFNIKGLKPKYCKLCKTNEMTNVANKKCIGINKDTKKQCNIRPNYNIKGSKTALYCKMCALPEMTNVKSKTCIGINKDTKEQCNIQPNYNIKGSNKPLYCKMCALPGMTDIKHNTCIGINKETGEQCNIQPSFNIKGTKIPLYCKMCALPEMTDIKSKRCIGINKNTGEKCNILPCFNIKGTKIPLYCKTCALPGMVNVKDKTCINEWCNIIVKNKYKGYCFNCYIDKYPDEPIVINYKIKESYISNYIINEYSNYQFRIDKVILGGSSNRRPDILLDLEDKIIIIEIDEKQHKCYDDLYDDNRLKEISNDVKNKNIICIRINPDGYKIGNKQISSCWGLDNNKKTMIIKKEQELNDRLLVLKETFEKCVLEEVDKNNKIKVIKLFFDSN